jgi:hypothetical protein
MIFMLSTFLPLFLAPGPAGQNVSANGKFGRHFFCETVFTLKLHLWVGFSQAAFDFRLKSGGCQHENGRSFLAEKKIFADQNVSKRRDIFFFLQNC